MKIRNAIIALGLAMVLSFGFAAPASAHIATDARVQQIDGVCGIIQNITIESNLLVIQLNTENVLNLSLVSSNGTTVWATTTNVEFVTIPVQQYAGGTYTLVVVDSGKTFYYPVQLANQSQAGASTM